MRPSDISNEIFNTLFDTEHRSKLANEQTFDLPANFPREIENPVIVHIYDNEITENYTPQGEIIILGSYTPMKSPGRISFHKENLTRYSASLIRKVINTGISLDFDTALFIIFFVVNNTMKHESFHYYCDYKRQITSARYDRDLEEAFAVAHSWHEMYLEYTLWPNHAYWKKDFRFFFHEYLNHKYYNSKNEFRNLFNRHFEKKYTDYNDANFEQLKNTLDSIFEFLIKEHFRGFTVQGYRDWYRYKDSHSFYEEHIFNYIKNPILESLLANGVPVNDIHSEVRSLGNKGAIIYLI